LTTEFALGTHLARHTAHLGSKAVELVDHRVDRVFQLQDLTLNVHRDLAAQVPLGDGCRHFRDVAHLTRQVRRHRVYVISQVLPRTGHPGYHGVPPKFTFRAHLARHTAHLGSKPVELIDHRVDRVLQLEYLTAHINGDLWAQVTARHRRRHLCDLAHLARQVRRHRVHVVRQVFP